MIVIISTDILCL